MGELLNMDDLQPFIAEDVGVTIYDKSWTDQSAFRSEKITKVELCPSETHLRIYFNRLHFFAVPRDSEVNVTESEWSAFDKDSGLYYVIRRESDGFD